MGLEVYHTYEVYHMAKPKHTGSSNLVVP
jgi:hypothetical protein